MCSLVTYEGRRDEDDDDDENFKTKFGVQPGH